MSEHDRQIGRELLRQNGLKPGSMPEEAREKLEAKMEQEERRARRMKWATIVSWVMVACVYVGAAMAESLAPDTVLPMAPVILMVAMALAIVFTVSYFLRSRSARWSQIQITLRSIQEDLDYLMREHNKGKQN